MAQALHLNQQSTPQEIVAIWQDEGAKIFSTSNKITSIAIIILSGVMTALCSVVAIKSIVPLLKTNPLKGLGLLALNLPGCALFTYIFARSIYQYYHRRKAFASANHFVNQFLDTARGHPNNREAILEKMSPHFQDRIGNLVLQEIREDLKANVKNSPFFYYNYPKQLTGPPNAVVSRVAGRRVFVLHQQPNS